MKQRRAPTVCRHHTWSPPEPAPAARPGGRRRGSPLLERRKPQPLSSISAPSVLRAVKVVSVPGLIEIRILPTTECEGQRRTPPADLEMPGGGGNEGGGPESLAITAATGLGFLGLFSGRPLWLFTMQPVTRSCCWISGQVTECSPVGLAGGCVCRAGPQGWNYCDFWGGSASEGSQAFRGRVLEPRPALPGQAVPCCAHAGWHLSRPSTQEGKTNSSGM